MFARLAKLTAKNAKRAKIEMFFWAGLAVQRIFLHSFEKAIRISPISTSTAPPADSLRGGD